MVNIAGFDATEVEPTADFTALKPGWYQACILSSEKKTTKKGDGEYLELEIEILGDIHSGRKVWDRLNLWNPNAKAVEIAKGTLSAICPGGECADAAGLERPVRQAAVSQARDTRVRGQGEQRSAGVQAGRRLTDGRRRGGKPFLGKRTRAPGRATRWRPARRVFSWTVA